MKMKGQLWVNKSLENNDNSGKSREKTEKWQEHSKLWHKKGLKWEWVSSQNKRHNDIFIKSSSKSYVHLMKIQ